MRTMKKTLAIVGGVLGFLLGVIVYMFGMELVFESDRLSTKIGALFAIGGAIGGSALADPGQASEPDPHEAQLAFSHLGGDKIDRKTK